MVNSWIAVPIALPIIIAGKLALGRTNKKPETERDRQLEDGGVIDLSERFICERVCTSDRLVRRMGGLSKGPAPHTCVTVCGVSRQDACSEACQMAVCNTHQVEAWNQACKKRCTNECLKGRLLD
eukprot:TRINITY_DN7540_c0_g1_i1.p2 TRINITY_DN7540_c0_g1~~TRINITY_DN7540_c0_g1_i1.p2  ORF type:complete len:125 (-),score=16.28 TRINITY_DN7540_c0_g1_i1:214-588(-)